MLKYVLSALIICGLFACKHKGNESIFYTPDVSQKLIEDQHNSICKAPQVREKIIALFGFRIHEDQHNSACELLRVANITLAEKDFNTFGAIKFLDINPPIKSNSELVVNTTEAVGADTKYSIAATAVLGILLIYETRVQPDPPLVQGLDESEKQFSTIKAGYPLLFDKSGQLVLKNAINYKIKLLGVWSSIYPFQNSKSWKLQAQIINEIDTIVELSQNKMAPVDFEEYPKQRNSFTPIFELKSINPGSDTLRELSETSGFSMEEFEKALALRNLTLLKEPTPNGVILDWTFAAPQSSLVYKFETWHALQNFVSSFLGTKTSSPLAKGQELDKIAEFSSLLGIRPWEVVKEENNSSIRGARFLYGKEFFQYSNLNDWMLRSLSEKAKRLYLQNLAYQEASLASLLGFSEYSRFIISDQDQRARYSLFNQGNVASLQNILGKILNNESARQARLKQDLSINPQEIYAFQITDLLKIQESHIVDKLYDSKIATEDLTEFRDQVLQGQKELLRMFYEQMNARGVLQVLGRIPQDQVYDHAYALDGYPMTLLESVEYLEEQVHSTHGQLNGSDLDKQQELRIQLIQLEHLRKIFTQQEELLLNKAKNPDFYGTKYAIDTRALTHSDILSMSSSKFLAYRTGDGKVIFHFFLGGTGVNATDMIPLLDAGLSSATTNISEVDIAKQAAFLEAFGPRNKLSNAETPEMRSSVSERNVTVVSYYFADEYHTNQHIANYLDPSKDYDKIVEARSHRGEVLVIKSSKHMMLEFLASNPKYSGFEQPKLAIAAYLRDTQNSLIRKIKFIREIAKDALSEFSSSPESNARDLVAWNFYLQDGDLNNTVKTHLKSSKSFEAFLQKIENSTQEPVITPAMTRSLQSKWQQAQKQNLFHRSLGGLVEIYSPVLHRRIR